MSNHDMSPNAGFDNSMSDDLVKRLRAISPIFDHAQLTNEAANEIERLRTEGKKDYEDMRKFQAKYIAADQRAEAAETKVAKLREALGKVKQRCLFVDDDGRIGVTQEPHIEDELFDEICQALTETEEQSSEPQS